jgi:hypothetical protein
LPKNGEVAGLLWQAIAQSLQGLAANLTSRILLACGPLL